MNIRKHLSISLFTLIFVLFAATVNNVKAAFPVKKAKTEKVVTIQQGQQESGLDAMAMRGETNTLLLVIIALFIPPLAVYLHQGEWNGKCWLNLLLTLLFFLPGFIHALIVILGK